MTKAVRFLWFLMLAAGAAAQPADFRSVRWGMSVEQVIAAEGRPPDTRQEAEGVVRLRYDGLEVAERRAELIYELREGRLVYAQYRILADLSGTSPEWMAELYRLYALLDGKYGGDPQIQAEWRNSTYRLREADWAYAASVGDVDFFAIWRRPNTAMILKLAGAHRQARLTVAYGQDRPVSASGL